MLISLIAAVADNGVIGRDNQLPFHQKEDMRFFVRTTKGHTVITGRKNFDAMGRALPGRENLIVSRDQSLVRPGARVFSSVEEALGVAEKSGETEAFVIGGAQIYALALPYAHRFYRTRVHTMMVGDVTFPEFDETEWSISQLGGGEADAQNEFSYTIELLERAQPPISFT
jgi:dihydrofolate reductase